MAGLAQIYYASLPAYVGYATPTDMISLIGSSTKLIRVKQMRFACQSTAGTLLLMKFTKRSTLSTGGTSAAITSVPSDKDMPAASATALQWSVIPAALGTAVISSTYGLVTTVLTAAPAQFAMNIPFPNEVILRGANDSINIGLAGAALPAGFTAIVDLAWSEEDL